MFAKIQCFPYRLLPSRQITAFKAKYIYICIIIIIIIIIIIMAVQTSGCRE